jgi:hypothetical protein
VNADGRLDLVVSSFGGRRQGMVVAIVAIWLPAVTASRAEPTVLLRTE